MNSAFEKARDLAEGMSGEKIREGILAFAIVLVTTEGTLHYATLPLNEIHEIFQTIIDTQPVWSAVIETEEL